MRRNFTVLTINNSVDDSVLTKIKPGIISGNNRRKVSISTISITCNNNRDT